MLNVRSFAVATALLVTPAFAAAQGAPVDVYGFGAVSLPTGDFGDDSGAGAGGANTSFAAGIDLVYSLDTPGLGWVSTASFMMNGLEEDLARQAISDNIVNIPPGTDDVEVDAGSYIMVPLMTGLRYEFEASPTMRLFGMGQLGLTIVRGPSLSATNQDEEVSIDLDMAQSFGFSIGGGLMFSDRFGLTFRYLPLGEVDPEGTIDAEGFPNDGEEAVFTEVTISTFLLGATVRF